MLNRHFLRSKVLQSLYAYFTIGDGDITKQEKAMFSNISEIYNLEMYLISALLEIRDLEQERIEEAKNKFFPTEEEKNPNLNFVNNCFWDRIVNHEELKRVINRLHINWRNERDLFRSMMMRFRQSDSYKEFMNLSSPDYESCKKVVTRLFKNYVIRNENLFDILCEKGFGWECDYEYVGQISLQFLKNWMEEDEPQKAFPRPFDKEDEDEFENDRDFIKNLYRNTILHEKEYEPYIEKRIVNWDRDRLALLDVLIIKMGMSEFIYCPHIPLRVSLNEYIELAKEFSTEKSRLFVNGILDRMVTDLRMDGKIHKNEHEELFFESTQDKDLGVVTASVKDFKD